ncbi:MAG: hypothetical protein Q4G43_03465 [Mobilicoccus sp.]|nr:hypothetical protein [Mobilicoccus sp.]
MNARRSAWQRRALGGATVLLVAFLSACTTSDTTAEQPGQPTTAAEAQSRGSDPVASVTVPAPQGRGDLTFSVLGLERRDDLLVLTATVTRSGDAQPDGERAPTLSRLYVDPFSPTVVDPVNAKLHRVVEHGSGQMATEPGVIGTARLEPDQPVDLYAVFAAPPADVTHVDVRLFDAAPTITAVPID